jgi:hypothetical protein
VRATPEPPVSAGDSAVETLLEDVPAHGAPLQLIAVTGAELSTLTSLLFTAST